MAVDAVLRIQADNLRIFPTKLLFCNFGNFIFGLFPDVFQNFSIPNGAIVDGTPSNCASDNSLAYPSRTFSATIFDFIEHLVRLESFVSHHFSGQLFLLLTLMEAKNMLCLMTRALTF